ncbi:uncharacterized protein N7459_008952 [Penicillium hispanicum]|uniref:uncharacterized protein n=1 Tax=Penicillium hispanicum TaxID=1080232 RepID=UPI0025416E2F|nr:uncharacterized protein N7459_008952 [Penicillium hispanicum]KAJ5569522.1 hypothetical protein N7459_008952 [Penicillium hispanicum]
MDGGLSKRSCVRCNQRKVRCDRKLPCGRCLQSGDECIHPGVKRAPRKLQRPPIAVIRARLQQLEGEVERLRAGSQPTEKSDSASVQSQAYEEEDTLRGKAKALRGRLVLQDESKTRYVGDEASVILADKLQEMCDQSGDEDSVAYAPNASTGGLLSPFVETSSSNSFSGEDADGIDWQQPLRIEMMWSVYKDNVAPLISVLHKPSVESLVRKASANAEADLGAECDTLIRAFSFAAIVSMNTGQCVSIFGEERDVCLLQSRRAVEQSLARANLVGTHDIRVLQAAVLFLLCLRCLCDSRLAWAQAAVVVRVAQRQGIHRDGQRLNLTPFDIEMRRRLWWHICILDMLCSEDQGTDLQIRPGMFDTKPPLNIDDDDLTPDLADLPLPRDGFTDITLCIIQCEIMTSLARTSKDLTSDGSQISAQEGQGSLSDLAISLEERYLEKLDLSSPIQWLIAVVARLTLSRVSLVNRINNTTLENSPNATDDEAFRMAIEILEFATLLQNDPSTLQWAWLSKSYKQQHVVALILSELCVRPISPETDHAWDLVVRMYDEWQQENPQTNTLLQGPLSLLMERASISRESKAIGQV